MISIGSKVIYKTIIYEVENILINCCSCILGDEECSKNVDAVLLKRINKWVDINDVIVIERATK